MEFANANELNEMEIKNSAQYKNALEGQRIILEGVLTDLEKFTTLIDVV